MEAVVFCGIAGLVAFCVAGLLPGGAVASRPCGFAAGGVNQILLLTGRIFDRAPRGRRCFSEPCRAISRYGGCKTAALWFFWRKRRGGA